jgi:hypothetical protein
MSRIRNVLAASRLEPGPDRRLTALARRDSQPQGQPIAPTDNSFMGEADGRKICEL